MKTKFLALVMLLSIVATESFALFGTATYSPSIMLVPCSGSGGVGMGAGGKVASIEGAVEFAHYPAVTKSCPGWSGFCSGAGEQKLVSYTPSSGCH
jgi:hypothetical protein